MKVRATKLILSVLIGAFVAADAGATMPVVDVAAIKQLLQQMNAWQQQLRGMQSQLTQLQQTHQALTGRRGMEGLLLQTAVERNYLPNELSELSSLAVSASNSYRELAGAVKDLSATAGRLTPVDVARLPADARDLLSSARTSAAENQAVAQLAYAHSSVRFSQLSTLIDRIGAAPDLKAIADLQGRIAAEQAMLANETVKLQAYSYAADAQRAAAIALTREQIVHGHGTFAHRFQPVPPAP